MKQTSLLFTAILLCLSGFAQQSKFNIDPQETFKLAKELFQKEQYSLAYPLFKDLQQTNDEFMRADNAIVSQEIEYYTTVCGLKQNEKRAEAAAVDYIDLEKNNPRVQQMSFHLAEYYFRQEKFYDAVRLYEQSNIANLSNREIADMKFHQGYAYFNLQKFAQAKPLFNAIRTIKDDPNYIDANYYYGFLAFRDKNYNEALQCFRIVENEKNYAKIVPYYIAQIYYIQGKKDEALAYAENKIKSGASQYYDLELKQLLGHAYFEKKEYNKALPYLEDYVRRSDKVTRENLYELSYAYYQAKNYPKAIEGFRQLSGKDDSLSQHAMYLLGDAYLKTGEKANARNAFLFCSSNSSNPTQKEISRYKYAKLSYELGYQDEALKSLQAFLTDYPNSSYTSEARELLVGVLANTNNYNDALRLMEGMSNPSQNAKRFYPQILYGRASELINDGRLGDADALLNKALKDPNNARVLPFVNFWKGEIAYRNNDLDNAIRYYNAYRDAGSPANGEANDRNAKYNLGYCYLKKENYPVARQFFESLITTPALNTDPFTQDAYIRTADCYYMMKNYTRAKSMYDNVTRLSWPAEDYATFQVAMMAGVRSAKEKISLMNTMIRKFPKSNLVDDANMEIANAYLADERFGEAIPFLINLINAPGNTNYKPQAYLKLGTAYYNTNNNSEALNQYKKLVSLYPNSQEAEDALNDIRTVYVEMGQPDDYAAFMRQAGRPLSASTEDSLTWAAAEIQYQNGNKNAALSSFAGYLQRFPNGANAIDAQYFSAEIYNERKDWPNALKNYEAVAAKAPNRYAESSVLLAARIYFFELKDYGRSEIYFSQLKQMTNSQENRLEAMRGLLRSQYQLQKWTEALENAKELVSQKGSSTDDKTLAGMAIGKSYQVNGQYDLAINNYKTVVSLNKAALAAEARYEIADCFLSLNKLSEAEKAAFEVINKSGSYDFWVTKSYILLGDVFFRQKDYFNAKATFQSVVDNTIIPELKNEAQVKLDQVVAREQAEGKING